MKPERFHAFDLPLKTISALNVREHWSQRSRRVKRERQAAWLLCPRNVALPVSVYMTRHSAGKLDDDNLRGALKGVRDGIADAMQVDDADERVMWIYRQEHSPRGTHLVSVQILEMKVEKGSESAYNHPKMPKVQI